MKAARNLLSKNLITQEQIFSILKFTDKGDTWVNIEEKIDNNKALISINFLKHSRENMQGFRLSFKAEYVTGSWKLDMSDNFRVNDDGRGIQRYLLDRFRGY